MIRFCVLGSGSAGNAIYFESDGYKFLIDCGFSKKEIERRLATINRKLADITAVFLTHDHGDHLAAWLKKGDHPLLEWQRRGTLPFFLQRFPLSHDAVDACGYIITDHFDNKVAVINDTGCIPEEALGKMFDCNAILIECNYDVEMLIVGRYSVERQERIASDMGHLRNEDAAAAVECLAWAGLQHVVALHLSQSNNNPGFVRQLLQDAVRDIPSCSVDVSEQGNPGRMRVIL